MPSLKKLSKELRQEIVSYLFPFPPCTTNLAFRLATLVFAKTRFCSHINFIGRCLQSKVTPKGFRSNFHASSFSRSNQYLYQIQCAQNSFSRNIMRITIRHMSICGHSLHQGTTDSRKNLEQRFIFQIGTLNPHGINERFSFNIFIPVFHVTKFPPIA